MAPYYVGQSEFVREIQGIEKNVDSYLRQPVFNTLYSRNESILPKHLLRCEILRSFIASSEFENTLYYIIPKCIRYSLGIK